MSAKNFVKEKEEVKENFDDTDTEFYKGKDLLADIETYLKAESISEQNTKQEK